MSGALMQLNSYGSLLGMLCERPEVNFFVQHYPRYVNFAMQIEMNSCNAPTNFGKSLTFTFNRSGDFVGQTFFLVRLPTVTVTSTGDPSDNMSPLVLRTYLARYIDFVGAFLFRRIIMRVNNQHVSELSEHMLYILTEYTTAAAKRALLDRMLGQLPELVAPICSTDTTTLQFPATELTIPVPFWFSTGAFFPLCCCNKGMVLDLITEVRPFEDLMIFRENTTYQITGTLDIQCYSNYIYLDTRTRDEIVTSTLSCVIEQFMTNGAIESMEDDCNCYLSFQGLVKELFIAAQHRSYAIAKQYTNFAVTAADINLSSQRSLYRYSPLLSTTYGDLLRSIELRFSGVRIMDPTNAILFRDIEPLWYHTAAPRNSGLHCYSFALNPEGAAPSGCVDFTMITNPTAYCRIRSRLYSQVVTNTDTTFELMDVNVPVVAMKPIEGTDDSYEPPVNTIGTLDTTSYTGEPGYLYHAYAICYNMLVFKNGYAGLRYV